MKLGTWLAVQVPVKAPGKPKITTLLPANNDDNSTELGPSGPMNRNDASGSLAPTEMFTELIPLVVDPLWNSHIGFCGQAASEKGAL